MQVLAAATAVSKAMEAVQQIQELAKASENAQKQSITLSITAGSSRSQSTQRSESNTTADSSVIAGKGLNLIATGAGKDSNVTVSGSRIAGQDVLIEADNAVNLQAAKNISEQHSKDSSSSAAVGLAIGVGKDGIKAGVTVSGSVSRGHADGTDTSFTTTRVSGGNSVTLNAGGDANLKGAVVTAPNVRGNIGGNLNIQSLQDTAKFDSKSESISASATVGVGAGGNVSYSNSKVNADYAAVGEQSGIRAGDQGVTNAPTGAYDMNCVTTQAQWVRAASLAPGMCLVGLWGQQLTVQSQQDAGWKATVYNVQVHEHETYHVGDLGIWVHNADCCKVMTKTEAATTHPELAKRKDIDQVIEAPVGSKGNWEKAINGELPPKTAIVLDNVHTYVTDSTGRVKEVEGQLSLTKSDRNEYQQRCAGKSGCTGDDGGHLIASSLGGAGDRINIVPQESTLNRGDWRAMENELRAELAAGKTVSVKIDVEYPQGGGPRPSEFRVVAIIDGKAVPYPPFKQ